MPCPTNKLPWLEVWDCGIAPQMTDEELTALADGLRDHDERIIQGHTTEPLPLLCVSDWPCEKADALGFAYLATHTGALIGEVEQFFAQTCYQCDVDIGEVAACRWFLNWHDDTPKLIMFRDLLAAVENTIYRRRLEADEANSILDDCREVRYAEMGGEG